MAGNQPGSDRKVGAATEPCPLQKCSVLVQVMRGDTKEYMSGAAIKLTGPTSGSGQTAAGSGSKSYDPVEPGAYQLEVSLPGKQAEEFEVPRIPGFTVSRGEAKVLLVQLKRITAWIGFVMVDEEGSPVPDQRYRIKFADGTVKEGRLDSRGRGRYDPVAPGQCEISFPDIDQEAWEKI